MSISLEYHQSHNFFDYTINICFFDCWRPLKETLRVSRKFSSLPLLLNNMTVKIGILSDTHLFRATDTFRKQVATCFHGVSIILHAGDLTDLSVLEVFGKKKIYAVHGNMCHGSVRNSLPEKQIISVEGFRIGLTHGSGIHNHIEDHLIRLFDDVDCIVSGHTHRAGCHQLYGILFINPGSFLGSSRYGAPGTYAILEVGETLNCQILEVSGQD